MVKKVTVLWVSVIAFSLFAAFGSSAGAQEKMDKMGKEGRWEGEVVRSSPDKCSLTVRKVGSSAEKTIRCDSSTRWVSQEHGSKKVNNIDASQVKDGDRVICIGYYDGQGEFHAALVSKRLSYLK